MTDLLIVLGKVLKHSYEPIFDKLYPSLMLYGSEDKDIIDNIQLVGLFAENINRVPSLISKYHQKLVPYLLSTMK